MALRSHVTPRLAPESSTSLSIFLLCFPLKEPNKQPFHQFPLPVPTQEGQETLLLLSSLYFPGLSSSLPNRWTAGSAQRAAERNLYGISKEICGVNQAFVTFWDILHTEMTSIALNLTELKKFAKKQTLRHSGASLSAPLTRAIIRQKIIIILMKNWRHTRPVQVCRLSQNI